MSKICNETPTVNPQAVFELLDSLANRRPDAVAISAPGRSSLTYAQVRSHLDDVTNAVGRLATRETPRIAMVLSNGPEMALAYLSISSFAVCAPLNPAYRAEEFEFYLSDLNANVLIVESGIASPAIAVAQKYSIPVVELRPELRGPAGKFSLSVNSTNSKESPTFSRADDTALILHTSGTTSRPKMVALTHGQLLASAATIARGLQLTDTDRCLNVMPLFHIHGLVGALLSSMIVGASVICTAGWDSNAFCEWLVHDRPTWYTAVPTIHQAVLSCAKKHPNVIDSSSLRLIRSCSAPLPVGIANGLEETFRVPVIEAYGMTEAAHQIASNPLPPKERKLGSVGLPSGTEIAIMDDGHHLLSRGEVGEIVVRGPSIITGYAQHAVSHDESFMDGWFRTGDQGYIDNDGYVFLTGRLKEIINRGGEKISPKEVEDILLGHTEISQAVVFRLPHPSLGDDVAAALVLRLGSHLTEAGIREYLLDRMAEFKVPRRVLIVDEIPKGATGKVNRTELSERFGRLLASEDSALNNELEERIAGIYCDVLGAEKIGRDDNFFELGGDSLRASQVINRVRAQFQVNLSIATIFRRASVGELASEIVRAIQDTGERLKDPSQKA